MAATKDDGQTNMISHLETLSDQEKQYHSQEEEILGRDFTVAESELPKGYFTSANFLGSSESLIGAEELALTKNSVRHWC